MALADFLRRNSDFVFFLDDYIRALSKRDRLKRRFQRFLRSQYQTDAPAMQAVLLKYCRLHDKAIRSANPRSFEEIPLTVVSHLKSNVQHHSNLTASVWNKYSSGSTGRPTNFYFSEMFSLGEQFLTHRKVQEFSPPSTTDSDLLFLFVHNGTRYPNFVLPDVLDSSHLFGRMNFDERCSSSISTLWTRLYELKPIFLSAKPALLRVLMKHWDSMNLRSVPFEKIVMSGSLPDSQLVSDIRSKWGVAIIDLYATTEFGSIAIRGPNCSGHHVDSSSVYVEAQLSTPAECNASRIMVSSASNSVLPLMRYDIGDQGFLHSENCNCGKLSPVMSLLPRKKHELLEHADRAVDAARFDVLYKLNEAIRQVRPTCEQGKILVNIRLSGCEETIDKKRIDEEISGIVPLGIPTSVRYEN